MSLTDINNESRYLISTEEDELWGLVVTSVGSQTISAKESYPPSSHPQGFFQCGRRPGAERIPIVVYH